MYAQTIYLRKHLLSATHNRCFTASPLVFLFLGFLPLQLNQIWRILCVMFGEEDGGTLFAKTISY
jgi:hypothetical protein